MQLKHGDMAWRGRETGGGRQGGIFCLLHTISYFTYEMVDYQGKLPRRAILESIGQDARRFRPVRHDNIFPFH